jgi:hypothetical protein
MIKEFRLDRTHKDERAKKTATIILEVLKNSDSTYEVFYKGEHVGNRVQQHWLEPELCVRYGYCGDEYDSIIRQLNDSGRATIFL